VDEVFGGEEAQPVAAGHTEGDVYDDMPDDEEQ
jgi:hypothetical protein